MQEFPRVRVAIDSLIDGIKESIKCKPLSGSLEQLEQACGLIQELKRLSMADQASFVTRRAPTIADLADIAGKIKAPAIKKKSTKETLVQTAAL